MPKEESGKLLSGKITIPGTKTKVPTWGVLAVGAAGVAALLLFKGKSTAGAEDLSAIPEEEDTSANGSVSSALAGALEDMGARLAAIEAAGVSATSPAAVVLGSPGEAPAVVKLPFADPLEEPAAEVDRWAAQGASLAPGALTAALGPKLSHLLEPSWKQGPAAPAENPIVQAAEKMLTPARTAAQLGATAYTPPLSYIELFNRSLAAPSAPSVTSAENIGKRPAETIAKTQPKAAAKKSPPAAIAQPPTSYINIAMRGAR